MKQILTILLLLLCTTGGTIFTAQATTPPPIRALLQRILPQHDDADKFDCQLVTNTMGKDFFELSSDGKTIFVKAPNPVSMATGIHYFLQHYAGTSISWNQPQTQLPPQWPAFAPITRQSSIDYRYYLNFCTHSYTMAFWNWERWQQEIDWMALHGINMPLVLQGMENVWMETLTHYGYAADDLHQFLTGNTYYGWFFMNNMTGWGGPMPASWYRSQRELGKKMIARMHELGMQPVLPGYVGMVPHQFLRHATRHTEAWKADDIVPAGSWCSFQRPDFVRNPERLKEFAAVYYAAMRKVYGTTLHTPFYDIDPFHEGGRPADITDTEAQTAIRAMWQALQAHEPAAVWVAQHWQANPKNWLTKTVPAGRLLILNLHGDSHGRTDLLGEAREDATGHHHDWIWGMTSNFGGNVGLFGRLQRMVDAFHTALGAAPDNGLKGIGAIPEGIENNPILYELLFALPWETDTYSLAQFLDDYIYLRYGVNAQTQPTVYHTLRDIWQVLANGIYHCPSDAQQGTTESVFLMRPADRPGTVSTWAGSNWYWDIDQLRHATQQMLSLAPALHDHPNYRYDLVDLLRQTLADHGKEVLQALSTTHDAAQRKLLQAKFLDMILTQDTLVGTLPSFRLGQWIATARNCGTSYAERRLMERNARMLLTTWGDRLQCNQGGLHDYANREWNGLLSSYYYPRWKAYFNGESAQPDFLFDHFEWPFVKGEKALYYKYLPKGAPYAYRSFSATPQGDPIAIAQRVWQRYFSNFHYASWKTVALPTDRTYLLLNATTWNGHAPRQEGICLLDRNADWSASCRLQHLPIEPSHPRSQWQFVPVEGQPHTYRLKSVALTEQHDPAPFLSTTPSSVSYPSYTLSAEGECFQVLEKNGVFQLKAAHAPLYMRIDEWTCMLHSATMHETGNLYLESITPTRIPSPVCNRSATSRFQLDGLPATPQTIGICIENGEKKWYSPIAWED